MKMIHMDITLKVQGFLTHHLFSIHPCETVPFS